MSISLLPKLMFPALTAVSPEMLHADGIRLLMLDFDNTIVPYTTNVPAAEMEGWIRSALASQLKICVVSNSRRPRVVEFCCRYGIDCITHARKPFGSGIRQCMRRYGCTPETSALVGDQIYTDVLGGNLAGVTSVLIPAIDNHNIWLKLRHLLEQPWIFAAKKRSVQP